MGLVACLADFVQFGMDVAMDFLGCVARGQIVVHNRAEPGDITATAFASWQVEVFRGHACGQAGIIVRVDAAGSGCGLRGFCLARSQRHDHQAHAEERDSLAGILACSLGADGSGQGGTRKRKPHGVIPSVLTSDLE